MQFVTLLLAGSFLPVSFAQTVPPERREIRTPVVVPSPFKQQWNNEVVVLENLKTFNENTISDSPAWISQVSDLLLQEFNGDLPENWSSLFGDKTGQNLQKSFNILQSAPDPRGIRLTKGSKLSKEILRTFFLLAFIAKDSSDLRQLAQGTDAERGGNLIGELQQVMRDYRDHPLVVYLDAIDSLDVDGKDRFVNADVIIKKLKKIFQRDHHLPGFNHQMTEIVRDIYAMPREHEQRRKLLQLILDDQFSSEDSKSDDDEGSEMILDPNDLFLEIHSKSQKNPGKTEDK